MARVDVWIQRRGKSERSFASLGDAGYDLILKLVKAGRATFEGGNGYPENYSATAAVIREMLKSKELTHKSIDETELSKIPDDEILAIEVWDRS